MKSSTLQRWLIVGLLVSNGILLAVLLRGHFAHEDRRARGQHPRERITSLVIERLELDEQQQVAFRALADEHRANVRQLDRSFREAKAGLLQGLTEPSITAVERDSLRELRIARLGELQQAIERAHYAHFEQVKELLQPEQHDNFTALLDDLDKLVARRRRPSNRAERGRRD